MLAMQSIGYIYHIEQFSMPPKYLKCLQIHDNASKYDIDPMFTICIRYVYDGYPICVNRIHHRIRSQPYHINIQIRKLDLSIASRVAVSTVNDQRNQAYRSSEGCRQTILRKVSNLFVCVIV